MQEPAYRIGHLLGASWRANRELKWTLWPAIIVAIILSWAINAPLNHWMAHDVSHYVMLFYILPLIEAFIVGPLVAGMVMTAVKHARGEQVSVGTPFTFYSQIARLGITIFIMSILSDIGWNLAQASWFNGWSPRTISISATIIALIITLFVMLAMPLAADKRISPIGAIVNSFRLGRAAWGQTLGIFLIGYIILMVCFYLLAFVYVATHGMALISVILMIILAIWLLPWALMVYGYIYHAVVDKAVL